MKLSAKDLKGSAVMLADKHTPIAIIKGLIFSGAFGKLLGFKVNFDKVIGFSDLNYDQNGQFFYVKSPDSICKAEDIVRIDKCLKSGVYFNNQVVIDELGKKCGDLYDVNFEPVTGSITEIVARSGFLFWLRERMISKHSIINVTEKFIKIKGDGATVEVFEKKLKNKTAPVGGAVLSDLLTN